MEKLPSIQTEQEYDRVVDEIGRLLDAQPETKEYERLQALVEIEQDYSKKHHPIDTSERLIKINTRDIVSFLIGFSLSTLVDLFLLCLTR